MRIGRRYAFLAIFFAAALGGCTGAPDGVTPVTGFALDRYLGTWYEIARLDHAVVIDQALAAPTRDGPRRSTS